jgi:biopolymer transport protein ExbD
MIQMKRALSITVFALSLALWSVGCKKSAGHTNVNASRSQYASLNDNQAGGRTVTLKEQGMSFAIPVGWRKDDESIEVERVSFGWRGPDNTSFALSVSMYRPEDKPEYGNRSIEDETNSFYRDHKADEDLRFLEIDGVRGVHFRRDSEDWNWDALKNSRYQKELHAFMKWNAQRMYGGKRQVISADLSCPARSFAKDQDTLYGILQTITFTQNNSESAASTPTPAETVDELPAFVAIPSDDEFYVRKRRVARTQVAREIDDLLWNLPEEKQIAYIKAGPNISYGTIVSIIDDLGAVGYDRVGLMAADKTRGKPKPTLSPTRATGSSKKDSGESSTGKATGAREDLLVVTVETATGGKITIKVAETPVPLRELETRVRALLKDRSEKTVRIVGPGTIHYGAIVEVIDAVRAGGAEAIALGVSQ